MEFRQLRYFLSVAEHLHFTEAAEHLGIAQPPLSQQIQKLEREIGTKLFNRFPRRVELTEAGERFRERAERILAEAEIALAEAKNAARGEIGRLVLGFAGSTVFHPLVATALRTYRTRYPKVLLECEESNSVELLEKVRDKRVDAALVRLPIDCNGLRVEPLVQEEFLVALPSNHSLAGRDAVALQELASHQMILFPRRIGPDLHDAILSACSTAGFSPKIGMESPQISSSVNMVAAGFGVALVPASISQLMTPGVSYLPLQDATLRTSIALVYLPREKRPAITNLVRVVHNTGKESV